jgi:DNA-binding NarL/FixJ family response regulator
MINKKIKIVVVDDYALFRRGLISLLAEIPEFQIVGEAAEGVEALKVIEKTNPDIILLDINMPGMGGIETVEALRDRKNKVKVMMLTISQHDEDLIGAIVAGADGYLLKNTEPEDLRKTIIRMVEGQSVLSPEVTGIVLRSLTRNQQFGDSNPLSDRELEVLQCLSEGMTTIQIGSHLFISENTVKTHIRHILEKLEAANRTEAVSKAIQMGLIQKSD